MSLTLCSNCRLPVNTAALSCPLCTAPVAPETRGDRRVSIAAAVAAVAATVAVLRIRRAGTA